MTSEMSFPPAYHWISTTIEHIQGNSIIRPQQGCILWRDRMDVSYHTYYSKTALICSTRNNPPISSSDFLPIPSRATTLRSALSVVHLCRQATTRSSSNSSSNHMHSSYYTKLYSILLLSVCFHTDIDKNSLGTLSTYFSPSLPSFKKHIT